MIRNPAQAALLQRIAARGADSFYVGPEAQKIVTIEGLSPNNDHPLQKAWAALDVPHVLPDAFPGAARELERLRLVAALEDAGLVLTGPGGRG